MESQTSSVCVTKNITRGEIWTKIFLALFVVLLAFSLIMIWLGHSHEEGLYSLAGFFFLFLLGLSVILPGTVSIPSGENVTITTAGNYTLEVHTQNYEPFNDTLSHSFGLWISLVAIFGFAITLTE